MPSQKAALRFSHAQGKQQQCHQGGARAADRSPGWPLPAHCVQEPWINGRFPGEGAHRARYLIVFALNFWDGWRQKWGLKIMMLRANSLLPCRGGEQTENQGGRYGCCCVAERENEKTQSLFFDKTFFGLIFLGPFLFLFRNFSRLFAPSFKG